MRTRLGVGVIIVMLAAALNAAYAQPTSASHYTHSELHKMMQEAHTEQQYKVLATYFRAQQQSFIQQAQSEKQEWERSGQDVTGSVGKYPRPVDSSRNRYEYLTYKADQMDKEAAHYESLSATAQ